MSTSAVWSVANTGGYIIGSPTMVQDGAGCHVRGDSPNIWFFGTTGIGLLGGVTFH